MHTLLIFWNDPDTDPESFEMTTEQLIKTLPFYLNDNEVKSFSVTNRG